MRDINEVHILGRAGKDGEVKYIASGKALGRVSVATGGGRKKDGDGDWPTHWHSITAWGDDLAAVVAEVRKGAWVEVFGRIEYSNKDGRYYTNVIAQKITLPEAEDHAQVERPAPKPRGTAITEDNPITDEDIAF